MLFPPSFSSARQAMPLAVYAGRAAMALAATLCFASCAQPVPMRSTVEVSGLPVNRGLSRGSFVARSTWQYRGSVPEAHEFRYYYYTQNDLRFRRVRTARECTVLDFPEVPRGGKPKWQWVVLRPEEGGMFRFELLPGR